MTRVIGPPKSNRRKWTFLCALLVCVGLGVLVIPGAMAVHDTGIFQLEGDAQQATPTAALKSEDWDNICKQALYTGSATTRQDGQFCQAAPGVPLPSPAYSTSGATKVSNFANTLANRFSFIQDGTNAYASTSDDIFKGGTDDGTLSTWLWKNAKPSPNKDDLETAFAAEYICTQALSDAGYCAARYIGHNLLFFGGTRYANNGNTNIGFWFLHNPVGVDGSSSVTDPTTKAVSCPVTSGCGFSDGSGGTPLHTDGTCSFAGANPATCTPGDIFVYSAFLIGGSQPTLNAYEWVGTGNATGTTPTNAKSLQQISLPGQSSAGCGGAQSGDQACAIVNTAEKQSPWLFQDSGSQSPANKIEAFELFEGGLDLTAAGFGNACISTFMVDTRSSGSSVDSVAQDFAMGQMGGCSSSIQTTAGLNAAGASLNHDPTSGTTTTYGTSNGTVSSGTDSATVDVQGVSTWSGTVDFYLCGPIAATAKCDANGVKLNGTSGNVGVGVSNTGATATSGSAALTKIGRYCWYAKFTPGTDSTTAGVKVATDDGSSRTVSNTNDSNPECFNVRPVTPTLTTSAVNASGTAIGCSTATPPVCTDVDFGQPLYDTAFLIGTAKQPSSSGTNTTYTSILAAGASSDGATAKGTITFWLYGPSSTPTPSATDCAALSLAKAKSDGSSFPSAGVSVNVSGNGTYPSAVPSTVSFTPDTPGYYFWRAQYSGDLAATPAGNTTGAPLKSDGTLGIHNSDCLASAEVVHVRQIPTNLQTAQSWIPNDTARVASSVGDIQAGGTVTFTLYANATCTAGLNDVNVKYAQTITIATGDITSGVATVSTSNAGGNTNTGRTITTTKDDTAGTSVDYSWKVVYAPASTDTAHVGRQAGCTPAATGNGVANDAASIEKFNITYTNDNSGGKPSP